MEPCQLELALAIRCPHHRDIDSDPVDPVDAVDPAPLDRCLALDVHPELEEERLGSLEVVDDDADVVQTFERHA
jgi:hypothetical protein